MRAKILKIKPRDGFTKLYVEELPDLPDVPHMPRRWHFNVENSVVEILNIGASFDYCAMDLNPHAVHPQAALKNITP